MKYVSGWIVWGIYTWLGSSREVAEPIGSSVAVRSIAIAFQLCFRLCHYEGSGKPGELEIKWYKLASGLC